MTDIENLPASIHQRLLNKAKAANLTFHQALVLYGIERLLKRLENSRFRDNLVLKGAMAFHAWGIPVSRSTRDIDFLGYGDLAAGDVVDMIKKICQAQVEPDGLEFPEKSIHAEPIRQGTFNQGIRVVFTGYLGQVRIPMAMDIAFGDRLSVHPRLTSIHTILPGFAPPKIRVYPPEAVFAEKLHAMAVLGFFNSRMKDYYDAWWIITRLDPGKKETLEAIKITFKTRKTNMAIHDMHALSAEFSRKKQDMWMRYIQRNRIGDAPDDLESVLHTIRSFIGSF